MYFRKYLLISALVAYASAHGVVRSITGANGVTMPGLSIADGTPRDCSSNRCGSQADTSIIRNREISSGKATPLGRTQGAGPVNAATMISTFMGGAAAAGGAGAAGATTANATKRSAEPQRNAAGAATGANVETMVAAMAGKGATSGLPTAADDGTITLTYRQVNQDGAGPLTAAVDGTSGGTDAAAFQNAQVTQNIPGVISLSGTTKTDLPVKVQMPAGMTCDATVAGTNNVCVVRVQNNAIAGPFGGSAAFTQSPAARKRAIAYRLKKRMEFRV